MATASRTTTHLIGRLLALEEAPERYDFFAALRQIECLYADKPRIGAAARPADEPLRLGQAPSLAFATSSIASFQAGTGARPAHLAATFFGLFGPNGPLPLHLTEYAHSRELNFGDSSLRRFADIFHHRMLSLMYRAWADSQPVVSLDRPAPRRYDVYVGSLLGIAPPELRKRDALADEAKLGRAGWLALGTRPAEGLIAVLQDFTGLRFALREFVGEWLRLPEKNRLALGTRQDAAVLGRNSVLGSAVWSCQGSFELICGPLGHEELCRMLPGERTLARVRDLVRNYLGDEYRWTVKLVLCGEEVPECRLGVAGRLGWTTWLGDRGGGPDADEVVIDPFYRAATID
jgi:type VI secretion system protein ImpH